MRKCSAVRWLAVMSALVVGGCSGHGDPDPLLVTEPCKFLTASGTTRDLGFRVAHHPVSDLGVPADWVELNFKGSVEGMGFLTVFAHGFEIRIDATGVPDQRATACRRRGPS